MIQRIQTVYLLISVILMLACACLPLGVFEPATMEMPSTLTNLWIVKVDSASHDFSVVGLFIVLMAACVLSVTNIFGYKNLKRQSRQCLMVMMLQLFWAAGLVLIVTFNTSADVFFKASWPIALPVLALVFQILARRGIRADEKLLRSVDRIR